MEYLGIRHSIRISYTGSAYPLRHVIYIKYLIHIARESTLYPYTGTGNTYQRTQYMEYIVIENNQPMGVMIGTMLEKDVTVKRALRYFEWVFA